MQVIFSRLAKHELDGATQFYEIESQGVGTRFRKEVKKAIKRICDYPDAWSIELGEVRKCLLHRFPYKVLYSIEVDHIFIIAIAHQHRKPDYWVETENRKS